MKFEKEWRRESCPGVAWLSSAAGPLYVCGSFFEYGKQGVDQSIKFPILGNDGSIYLKSSAEVGNVDTHVG